MSKIFELSAIKNHPSVASFDLSRHQPFSAKAGELLPVFRRIVIPGDSFSLKHQHFTRTRPINTAAFVRQREYFDWYFVPLRLLQKSLPQALVQMQNNPVQAQSLTQDKSISTDIPHTHLYSSSGSDGSIARALRYMQRGDYANGANNPILNAFGFETGALSFKLLRYLRFGNFSSPNDVANPTHLSYGYTSAPLSQFNPQASEKFNMAVNLLFPAAYQKIYCDFFRYSQWERPEPTTYNFDYYTGGNVLSVLQNDTDWLNFVSQHNFFTLRYCNWPKDQFMGLLPDQQLGEVSTVQISEEGPLTYAPLKFFSASAGLPVPSRPVGGTIQDESGLISGSRVMQVVTTGVPVPDTGTSGSFGISALQSGFSVIQLRIAQALQKWKEVSQVADQDAVSQIYAHWGVRMSQALSDRCQWISGSAHNLDVNAIDNTNLADGNEATQAAKGIGSGQSSASFTAHEYGVLMCIYHVQPYLDYTITGQPEDILVTNVADIAIPEFDKIGLESLPIYSFVNSKALDSVVQSEFPMGYLPRYYSYKTDYDQCLGVFETTEKSMVTSLDPNSLTTWFNNSIDTSTQSVLNFNFFKVNPAIMNNIFAVQADSTIDTDQYLVNCYFDVKASRRLDYDGMPY